MMKQHKFRWSSFYLPVLLAVISALPSCKKTEIVPFERPSNNKILAYKVTNTADTLYGAINHSGNTITVYVPYYLGIDHIVPDIKLEDGATLLNAAGEVINLDGGIEPVPVDTTGYFYRVKGSDGAVRQYSLLLEIAPHPDELKVGYQMVTPGSMEVDYTTSITRAVYGRIPVYGNFGSTSTNAVFTVTNRATRETYTNVLKAYEITPGTNYYTMMLDISAYADSGLYDVQVKHQGRTAQLPPIHLVYQKPVLNNVRSTSAYAPGDTVTFSVRGQTIYNNQNGVLVGLERIYMKFSKSGFTFGGSYPSSFPADLFGQELPMKIVSASRTELKVIFPDLPASTAGTYTYSFTMDYPGIGFYGDFSDETGWGKNNVLATTGFYFTIKEKN